jgi:hypothetical protein
MAKVPNAPLSTYHFQTSAGDDASTWTAAAPPDAAFDNSNGAAIVAKAGYDDADNDVPYFHLLVYAYEEVPLTVKPLRGRRAFAPI